MTCHLHASPFMLQHVILYLQIQAFCKCLFQNIKCGEASYCPSASKLWNSSPTVYFLAQCMVQSNTSKLFGCGVMCEMNHCSALYCTVVTLAQMLAALTMGKSESALGRTVTLIPGKRWDSLASYFSAGPTVSTNTCREGHTHTHLTS